ncbi:MAG: hypothetical protein KF810_13190 [Rhizobiaceae bacterium]|nr:hypothetical protein [Rhizobiaceae bacterium]
MAKEAEARAEIALDLTLQIAVALNRRLGHTNVAIKTVAAWTGANERTVKNWFAGRYAPSAHHLIALAGKCDDVMEIFLMLACRPELLLAAQLGSARRDLLGALEKLHDLLTERE